MKDLKLDRFTITEEVFLTLQDGGYINVIQDGHVDLYDAGGTFLEHLC